MKFTKMEGCGNDYVYVNGFDTKIEDPNKLSEIVSNRHFGIGSDGLIVINPSVVADFKRSMYMQMVQKARCVVMAYVVLQNMYMTIR